jgi:4-hydroxybenzoate polyprenyltransferase
MMENTQNHAKGIINSISDSKRSYRALIGSMRVHQWVKNFLLFAALLFSQNFLNLGLLIKTVLGFIAFCALSSGVYLMNDIGDLEADRQHPIKSKRSLASGALPVRMAIGASVLLIAGSLGVAVLLDLTFGLVSAIYLALQIGYSRWLKHEVILDVFCVASGFLLRAVAGGVLIDVPLSSWFLICTLLLALFLALSKRRHELILLQDVANNHRKSLEHYSAHLLDQMISIVTAATLVSYALYTLSAETVAKFGTDNLKYTIPFVLYGIFRYLYLVYQRDEGGAPETLLTDKPLLINILLYAVTASLILYR